MPIVISPNIPSLAAQSATAVPDIVLQPGSVISAQVAQILANDQVRLTIEGQSIDVVSQVPLQAGQTLQLQVSQTAGGVGLSIVNPQGTAAGQNAGAASVTLTPDAAALITALATPADAAANSQLTPIETLAVSLAAQTAATQQTSLSPLFADLVVAAGLPALPPQVQEAVAQVLSLRTNLDQTLGGNDIRQALQASGLFLEASLAGSISTSNVAPDLKTALIVLRQALTTSLADLALSGTTGAPGSVPATQQGAIPATPQPPTLQDGAAQPDAAPQGTTAATGGPQGATPATAAASRAAQSTVQSSSQTVIISAGPEPPVAASPSIVPQLAAATASPPATAKAAAPAIAQEILELVASSQPVLLAPTGIDAAARAAASSAALNLLQEVLQAGPLAAGSPSRVALENAQALSLIPAVTGARWGAVDDADLGRGSLPPPPVGGALPAAQPVAPATLAAHVPVEAALQHLLADTDGAIARQTLLQIASLPGQTDPTASRTDTSAPRWNFEIPFATPQGTAIAQFEISRDGGGQAVEPAKRTWRARFSLDVEPAGPVHALVSLSGERTSVRMWAERPATASQLRDGVSQLSQALSRADLRPADIVVRDGAPVQPAPAPAGHFLDRAL